MFDGFGKMSLAELNEAAEGLFNEGDNESLRALAEENGIEPEILEEYTAGYTDKLATALDGALGRLNIESEDMEIKGLMEDWVEYIKGICFDNESFARKVMDKDKSLAECMGKLLEEAFDNRQPVPRAILTAAGISAGKCEFGVPGMGRAKEIIRKYYEED